MEERRCSLCGCRLNRVPGTYAQPTVNGRSHASKHHLVAERFFGRSANRPHTTREKILKECPWGSESVELLFCYECHEGLLHNPVFLRRDVENFAHLVCREKLNEDEKPAHRELIAGRIKLLHRVIEGGLDALRNQ